MKKFEIEMVRTYTTTIEVDGEWKVNVGSDEYNK